MSEFKDKILKELHSGEVSMTPRIYFSLQLAAFVALIAGILIASVFIFNFIVFSVRINSEDALLRFGPRGISAFLMFFPWTLLIIDAALIAALQWLMRGFRGGYKIPVLYLLLLILAGASLLGFALDRTQVNERFRERIDQLPPPFAVMYEGTRHPFPRGSGICRCEIISINDDSLIVLDTRNATATMTVFLPDDQLDATTSLMVGDMIFIAGEEDGDIIHAFGIHKVSPHHRPGPGSAPTTSIPTPAE